MPLKFVCLNLWIGGRLFDNILEFLEREQPDILVLQEVYRSKNPNADRAAQSFKTLQQTFGYTHNFFSPAFLDKYNFPEAESGNAILSRYPLFSHREIFFDIPYRVYEKDPGEYTHIPRNLQHAVVDFNGTELNIFNTQGIWGFDGEDNERRLAMGDIIAREVAQKPHTILAGDFNVQEGSKTTDTIEQHLKNIFKGERTSSFNMRHKTHPGFATAIVDMIFISPDFKVVNHTMPDDDVSDHKPLTAELVIL